MKVNTKQRKKTTKGFEQIYGKDDLVSFLRTRLEDQNSRICWGCR